MRRYLPQVRESSSDVRRDLDPVIGDIQTTHRLEPAERPAPSRYGPGAVEAPGSSDPVS